MKNLYLCLILLVSTNIYSQFPSSNPCETYDTQIIARPDLATESLVRFQYSTSTLLLGESQSGPLDTYTYEIKVEIVSNDGFGETVHESQVIDPSLSTIYEIINGRYVYNFYFARLDCNDSNTPLSGEGTLRVTIEKYIMLNFNGFIQPIFLSSHVCGESPRQSISDCASGGGNDDNSGEPNLTLTGVTVEVDGTTWDSTDNFGEPEPTFKYGKNHTFNLTIENDDSGDAGSSSYEVYVSEDENGYPSNGSNVSYYVTGGSVGPINGNSEVETSFSRFIYEDISTMQLQEDTTYYMFVHVDSGLDVDESNENNIDNIKWFPFKWENSSGRITLNTGVGLVTIPYDYTPTNNSVNLKVYHYLNTGFPVVNVSVSGQFATVDISTLQSGKYIIHVNDQYERMIKIVKR